jgi:hypothetical protein
MEFRRRGLALGNDCQRSSNTSARQGGGCGVCVSGSQGNDAGVCTDSGILECGRLRKRYGRGRRRKRKGFAEIRLPSGEIVRAELGCASVEAAMTAAVNAPSRCGMQPRQGLAPYRFRDPRDRTEVHRGSILSRPSTGLHDNAGDRGSSRRTHRKLPETR